MIYVKLLIVVLPLVLKCLKILKIWVAPVRHRFSQLMDEMDIHSKWDFPNEWVIEPNSLQCCNFDAGIEKESLTNVIKHSQAKHVSVK